jgi:uncharacterized protein
MARFLFPLAFLLVSCNAQSDMQEITLQSQQKSFTVRVEIADDPEEQSAGLMNREELKDGEGMLFVFSQSEQLSFWMKSTLIPLDLLFFDENGEFINGHTMEPCSGDPCKNYRSARDAKYALEVNAGVGKRYRIGPGWKLLLPGQTP